MANLSKWKLIICDLDGTLVPKVPTFDSANLILEHIRVLKYAVDAGSKVAVATNQGGVGARLVAYKMGWNKPEKYPSEADVTARLSVVMEELEERLSASVDLAYCLYWESIRGDKPDLGIYESALDVWDKRYRKPNAGMLYKLMDRASVKAEDTVMIGDSEDDSIAAFNAQVAYLTPQDAFGLF